MSRIAAGLTPIWPAASASASRASTFCSMRENADRDELDEERRPPTKLEISSFSILVACRSSTSVSETP